MARRMPEVNSRCKLDKVAIECLPIQVHVEILRNVCTYVDESENVASCGRVRTERTEIGLGQDTEIGMLQLKLMDPDGDIGALEVCKSAGMIKMEMAHDDSFDILDIVSSLGDLDVKLLVLGVVDSGKDVIQWSAPDLGIVWSSTRLEENQLLASVSSRIVPCDMAHLPLPLDAQSRWI
jgi:hypothetical protein